MTKSLVSLATAVVAAIATLPAGAATVDPQTRLQLVRQAAQKAGLAEVGLDHRDLYGVIHAESGWVARDGMGKNGVVSRGLAQFEPSTARAVGLRDPNDPVQAIDAAARLLREAGAWSARKLQGLALAPGEWEQRLREGVSIYYNVSTRTRSAWSGRNAASMPIETQQHIRNAREGALLASRLEGGRALPASTLAVHKPSPVPSAGAGAQPPQGRASYIVTAAAPRLPRGAQGIQLQSGYIQWSRGG